MNKKHIGAVAVLCLLTAQGNAAPRTPAQMKAAAMAAINQHRSTRHMAPRTDEPQLLLQTKSLAIMGYSGDGGFAVVSTDDLAPEVLGVSTSTYSQGRNTNFQWWLNAAGAAVDYAVEHNTPLKTTVPDPDKYPTSVEPMVTTTWDQDTPYSNMCPTYRGSVKCLTGCVATAIAQVLNYHRSPEHGLGQRTIYYPMNNSYSGEAVTADFENDYYDWDNMLDSYSYGYTREQADAVALLMRDCGVAVNMDYGGPDEGSGAYSDEAADGVRQYFGFSEARCVERNHYSESAWMDMVYRELFENGPLYYGGTDYSVGGHAFVLHGYQQDGKVYVNWGWSGDDDGYYNIALLDPSYYTFNYGQDMIIGISSNNHGQTRSESVDLAAAGTLQQAVEAFEGEDPITSLTISGAIDADDLSYLRSMAGAAEEADATASLRILDLSKASLTGGKLPTAAFKDCKTLRRLTLPANVTTIGDEAFSNCTSMYELRVPAKQVPALEGTSVFSGLKLDNTRLYVCSGLRAKYLQKAVWNSFREQNIIEYGMSVKVRSRIRNYGEENPTLLYTVSGGTLSGQPELHCEATPESPAGRYPITISRGTIESEDEIDFIDGYLVVQKIDATAVVGSYSREQGEPNPEFDFESYEGLIKSDSVPVWLKLQEPVFVCEADEESPVGDYPITVAEGAMAESYNMTFVPGVLTVSMPTALKGIEEVEAKEQDSFSLDGRRLARKPQKGLYISGGKLRGK